MYPFQFRPPSLQSLAVIDQSLGNAQGWRNLQGESSAAISLDSEDQWGQFQPKTNQQGAATTVYAAFDSSLQG